MAVYEMVRKLSAKGDVPDGFLKYLTTVCLCHGWLGPVSAGCFNDQGVARNQL